MAKEKLTIVWTSQDYTTFEFMVAMYAMNSLKNDWWKCVRVIIWGGSTKLIMEDKRCLTVIEKMIKQGVEVVACRTCATALGAVEVLENQGVLVDYMGVELTHMLKHDEAMITI